MMHLLARPPASPAHDEQPWLAFVRFGGGGTAARTALPLCYHLTPRVECYDATCALLDLGTRTEAEARALTVDLLERLASRQVAARAGIGPRGILAQFALLSAPASQRLALVTPALAPALTRAVAVDTLLDLAPRGLVAAEVVERLKRFGLRTLGQLSQLGEQTLRRQFGGVVGALLAALGRGEDSRPLWVTPPAHWHRARLRFCPALSGERALLALPLLVGRVLPTLRGHVAQAVRLGISWESGGRQERALLLRERTAEPHTLARETQRLLLALLAGSGGAIEELRLALGECARAVPEQSTFWRAERQRHAAVASIATSLARRHGRPLVLQSRLLRADAIFAEERYHLLPKDDALGMGDLVGADRGVVVATRRSARGAAQDSAVASAWDGVPQRLHWW